MLFMRVASVCTNTVYENSQSLVLSALCICLLPLIIETFIIFIARYGIIPTIFRTILAVLDATLEFHPYYNSILVKDVLHVIQRVCLGVILWFLATSTKCLLALIHTSQGFMLVSLIIGIFCIISYIYKQGNFSWCHHNV